MSDIENIFIKKFSRKNSETSISHAIIAAMTEATKVCGSCEKTLELSRFRIGRNTCTACKTAQHEIRISKTFESYLRNLCSHAKSSVKMGRRHDAVTWELEPEDLIALWVKQGGRCAISNIYLTHHKDGSGHKDYNGSIDRIASDKGYTIQNTQLVCYRINIMKHALSEDMFYWWIKTIHDFSCD